jgi:hypothetical protein
MGVTIDHATIGWLIAGLRAQAKSLRVDARKRRARARYLGDPYKGYSILASDTYEAAARIFDGRADVLEDSKRAQAGVQ